MTLQGQFWYPLKNRFRQLLVLLGGSGAHGRSLGGPWGSMWGALGLIVRALGSFWVLRGVLWEALGVILRSFGALWASFWIHLGSRQLLFAPFERRDGFLFAKRAKQKTQMFFIYFYRYFGTWGACVGPKWPPKGVKWTPKL